MPNKKTNLELTFDDPVPEDRLALIQEAQVGVAAGFMTVNQARQLLKYDVIPGQDIFLRSAMLMEVPANLKGNPAKAATKSRPLFAEEAQCEAYWTDYVKRAGGHEKVAIAALKTFFDELKTEALTNLGNLKSKGGEGSGNFDHEGRPGEVGGSGPGGGGSGESGGSVTSILSPRAQRARDSYKVSSTHIQRQAEGNEPKLSTAIRGQQNKDNEAFDVIKGQNAIEVKTIVRGSNDKITMHPDSLNRKQTFAKENGLTTHTVVFDDRNNKIYYKEGLGSFRLSNMQEIGSLSDLQGIIK